MIGLKKDMFGWRREAENKARNKEDEGKMKRGLMKFEKEIRQKRNHKRKELPENRKKSKKRGCIKY